MALRASSGEQTARRISRVPPHNIDAEQSVLGAMLESRDAIANVIDVVTADDFYKPAHAEIFDAIINLNGEGKAADAITVAEELARRDKLEYIGGRPYILGLIEAYPTASAAKHYAKIVEEHATLRRLITAGNEVQELGFSLPENVEDAVDTAEEIIYNVGDRRLREDVQHVRPLLSKTLTDIEILYQRGEAVTGVPSGFPDLDEKTSGWQAGNLIILAARPAMGKCASYSTLIDDPQTGERISIAQFASERRKSVVALGPSGDLRNHAVDDWIPNGMRRCFRLTTRTGRKIEVTANHPFLTVDGWVPLEDLTAGQRIGVPARLSTFGSDTSWSHERVRLLAYFIAEGGLTGRSPRFTNADPELVQDFQHCVTTEFPELAVTGPLNRFTYTAAGVKGKKNLLTAWLTDLALMGKLADARYLPDEVWRFDRARLREFLRVLFSCDGSVYAISGFPRIEFTVASERLAEDVQHALLRFGIVSELWRKTERSWRVEITHPEHADRYQREIGWLGEKTRRRFEELRTRHPHSNCGHVPQEAWAHVRKACQAAGISLSELSRRAGEKGWSNPHMDRSLPQQRLRRYAEVLDSPDLAWMANPDLYWDEIVSIVPVGEKEVYDLTVPGAHNFVADDICVHNSSLLNDFALSAAMRHNQPVVIFSLEMSRQEIVKRFLASEAKVDALRLSRGTLQEQDWTRMTAALGRLADAPIFIDDSPNITLMEMRAKCRRLKAKHGLGLVIIDYLQLMQSPRKSENRQQEVSEISRSLKILAKELELPVICASQLNRGVEYRSDKRPLLGDLRESGCLTGESLVSLADGRRLPIASLVGTTPEVVTLDGWGLGVAKASKVWKTGTKPVFRLRTATGREIRATGNHPFLMLEGWRTLEDLEVGDRIGIPRRSLQTSSTMWDHRHVVLLAHLIGDGSFLKNLPLRYASQSQENLDAVRDAAVAFGVRARQLWEEKARSFQMFLPAPYHLTHGRRNPIVAWLDSLGLFDKRSHQKFVPDEVYGLGAEQIALFLRHLWATDGCVWVRPEGRKGPLGRIYYATNSERLAHDVQALLTRLDIASTVRKVTEAGYRPAFHVIVNGAIDQLRFCRVVGGHGPRRAPVEVLTAALDGVVPNVDADTVPVEVWEHVKKRMKELGVTQREMQRRRGVTYGGTAHFRFAPSRAMLAEYATLLDDVELKEIATSDIYWDRVVSIEPGGIEDVYDMTVPGPHNFVANGISVHNSIEQDSDLVMFIYRDEVYNPDTESKGEAELIVAKHRNGPTGTVRLAFMNQYTKFASIARGLGR